MAASTLGGCAKSGCHSDATECATATACYTWLNGDGFISGGINDNGLFLWTSGGFMPQNGPTSEPQAVCDFAAWTAAGSNNN
jgi:hypothetical protein